MPRMDIKLLTSLTTKYLEIGLTPEADKSEFFTLNSVESQYAAYAALIVMRMHATHDFEELLEYWHRVFNVEVTSDIYDPLEGFCYEHDLIHTPCVKSGIEFQKLHKVLELGNQRKYGVLKIKVEGPAIYDAVQKEVRQDLEVVSYYFHSLRQRGVTRYQQEDGLPGGYLMVDFVRRDDPLCLSALEAVGLKQHALDVLHVLWAGNFNTRHKELYDRTGIVRLYAGLMNYDINAEEASKLSGLMDSLKLNLNYLDSLQATKGLQSEHLPDLNI